MEMSEQDGEKRQYLLTLMKDTAGCKFWLNPLLLGKNNGFSPKELNGIRKTIQLNMTIIMEAWHEYGGGNYGTSSNQY